MDDRLLIIAYYLTVFLFTSNEWPELIGPYHSKEECLNAEEVYEIRGYQTAGCSLIAVSLRKGTHDEEGTARGG